MGNLGYTSAALGKGIYLLLEHENIILMKFLFFFMEKYRKIYVSIKRNNKNKCRDLISSAIDINISI